MDSLDFDEYVELLRERLFDYEAVHAAGTLPDFGELMGDQTDTPEAWVTQAYEELLAFGHLNPDVSGMTFGPHVHGLLSADGRAYVRAKRRGSTGE